MNDRDRFDLVALFAESIGWHVELSHVEHEEDAMLPYTRLITISEKQTPRSRVYAVLHEVGHAQQTTDGGRLFDKGDWAELEVELDAWVRGWKLAERLELNLSRRGYLREAKKCLATYLPEKK